MWAKVTQTNKHITGNLPRRLIDESLHYRTSLENLCCREENYSVLLDVRQPEEKWIKHDDNNRDDNGDYSK